MDVVTQSVQSRLCNQNLEPGPIDTIISALLREHQAIDWVLRAITLILPTIFLAVVVFQLWVNAKWMFLDALTAAELSGDCCHSHYGFVSTTGIILWTATAAISLFAAGLLIIWRAKIETILFPLLAGLFTGWLTLDDAFLQHKTVLPALGIPQNLVIAFYGLLALSYFFLRFRNILRYDFWLLAMGVGALSLSVAVDVIFHSPIPIWFCLKTAQNLLRFVSYYYFYKGCW